MTKVIVRAPGKVSRRIAGVTFSEGRAEVDTDSAAFQFFKRRGYKVKPLRASEPDEASRPAEGHVAPTGEHDASQPEPEGHGPDGDEPGGDKLEGHEPDGHEPDDDELEGEEDEVDESEAPPAGNIVDAGERPHPVQGSKAVWFEYLTKIKPDHGFDLEKVSRKALIEAVEALEAK